MSSIIILSKASDIVDLRIWNNLDIRALDLSTLEFSQMKKRHFTMQSVLHTFQERTCILDTLHLEQTRHPKVMSFFNRWRENFFQSICSLGHFEDDILHVISNSKNKESEILKYLKPMEMMKMFEDYNRAHRILNWIINELIQNKTSNSSAVVEILKVICKTTLMKTAIFGGCDSAHLDFILRHSRYMRFSLWGVWEENGEVNSLLDVVTSRFFCGRLCNVHILLKYGIQPFFCDATYCFVLKWVTRAFPRFPFKKITRNILLPERNRRIFFLLQLLYVYIGSSHRASAERALQLFWRAIPDALLSGQEIQGIFSFLEEDRVLELCTMYRETICCGQSYSVPQPRTLLHYSRCAVRETVTKCGVLPEGIQQLLVSKALRSYLLLDW